jgi:hypothetical protein
LLEPWPEAARVLQHESPVSLRKSDVEQLKEIAATLSEVKQSVDSLRHSLHGWFERLFAILERGTRKRR